MKKCLVIYIGNGYSENVPVYDNSYFYSVDMRDNYENHNEMVFKHLREYGYDIDFALLTNKHKKYDEFVEHYNAIPLDYEDINAEDFNTMHKFYFWRTSIPPGYFYSGGRFLKLKNRIPEYDTYVIIRADVHFKMELSEMNVDFNKMNWLWPETDFRMFTELKDQYLAEFGSERWPWETYRRVNGNTFNIIPFKFFNAYSKYIWMEHTSFSFMLNDLYPLVSLDDFNFMLGDEKCWVTDVRFVENPVYTMNKKIVSVISDAKTGNFGVK